MRRVVEPEILDELPATDPLAAGSRGDLRRLNRLMGHAGVLARRLRRLGGARAAPERPLRMVELGCGDGELLLQVARRLFALGVTATVTLVDRRPVVQEATTRAFAETGWPARVVAADALAYLRAGGGSPDIILANLFLHHFPDAALRELLRCAAAVSAGFIACEPRRDRLPLLAARCLGLIGCNRVTRHDAVISVRAGFARRELSALWPAAPSWRLQEGRAGLFSQAFTARRHA